MSPSPYAYAQLNQANALRNAGRIHEAANLYSNLVSSTKDFVEAYIEEGMNFVLKNDFECAEADFLKAIKLGTKNALAYIVLAGIYNDKLPKHRKKAPKLYEKAMKLDPSQEPVCFWGRGSCYLALGKRKLALQDMESAAYRGYANSELYAFLGGLSEEDGDTVKAATYYKKGLEINPNDVNCLLMTANLVNDQGYREKALTILWSLHSNHPGDPTISYRMGSLLSAADKHSEALRYYEKGAMYTDKGDIISACAKGQCLSMLGRHEEAMEMYKTAQQRIQNPDPHKIYLPTFIPRVKAVLKAVIKTNKALVKIAAETAKEIAKVDQKSPIVEKYTTNFKELDRKKVVIQNKVLDTVYSKSATANSDDLASLGNMKGEFARELEKMRKEMAELRNEVKAEISAVKADMEQMQKELNSKMDDYHKKLADEVEQDCNHFSEEEKMKLKRYFSAFICTFSSAHVSAQVVDSGLVQLNSSSSAATVLSFMASFTPFVGGALQSGITSVAGFLKCKEMKNNARKLKGLAPDAVALSTIVGKSGFAIVTNQDKQKQIFITTDKDLDKLHGNAFQKLRKFCEQVTEKIDVYLYTNLYKTPEERIAHADASKLIQIWTKGDMSPYGVEEQFKELTFKAMNEQATEEGDEVVTNSGEAGENGNDRSACCSMF